MDAPKKVNIITHQNRTCIESRRILKKYQKQLKKKKGDLKNQIKRQVNG